MNAACTQCGTVHDLADMYYYRGRRLTATKTAPDRLLCESCQDTTKPLKVQQRLPI